MKLCCVLNRAMTCEACIQPVCTPHVRIGNTTYVANRSNKRGIMWLCDECADKQSKENVKESKCPRNKNVRKNV